MKEITVENIKEVYDPLKDIFRNWAIINEDTKRFENKAGIKTFDIIFKEDSGRLHTHFKLDCDGKYDKFRTYLTQEQANLLLLNLHINKIYIY
jgi:hypothetical protein